MPDTDPADGPDFGPDQRVALAASSMCTLAVSIAISGATDNGNGTFSVTFTATPTGGTAPYAFLWAFSLPDAVDPAALVVPQGQTTAAVTLTLPLAPYQAAGLAPVSGQTPPVWLLASCTVTDAGFVTAPSATFTVDSPTAGQGQARTGTWTTTGATAVTLDGVSVALNGSQSFTPFP